jgi:hypothetical protein
VRRVIRRCQEEPKEEEKSSEKRTFLTLEEAGLVEMSGLSTHERFLCRLTVIFLTFIHFCPPQFSLVHFLKAQILTFSLVFCILVILPCIFSHILLINFTVVEATLDNITRV